MSAPEISVLLPVWNAASTLGTCLRSVLRQRTSEWECLIVDDGSTDASRAIAQSFAERDPRFRVESRPHEGLVATLNAGARLCRAPLIARMDADDWMHRDRLALQRAALDHTPSLDAVGCAVRIHPRRGMAEGRRRYEDWLNSLGDAAAVWRERFIECPIAHPSLMLRRDRLLALGYRERGWPEDYDLVLRLLRQGPRVGVVPRRLIGWRDHPERLSRTDPRYALDRFTACRAWHLRRDFLAGAERYILWGHGRTGRGLRRALAEQGLEPSAIVEVHPRRIGQTIRGVPVIAPSQLSALAPDPVVVSVAGAGPREQIRRAMHELGFAEGERYVFAA